MRADLAEKTWIDFMKLKEEYQKKVLLYDIIINPDELNEIQKVMIAFYKGKYSSDFNSWEKYWGCEDVLFFGFCMFAKYVRRRDEKFWDGWKEWTDQGLDKNTDPNIYSDIKKFALKYDIYLFSSLKKTMYVSSFNTHAFLNNAHCVEVFHFLKMLAISNPYRMNTKEQHDFLFDIVKNIGQGIKTDLLFIEDESDDSDEVKKYYGLHRGFQRACSHNPFMVCNALELPFRLILNMLFSSDKYDYITEYQDKIEPFLVSGYKKFLLEISEEIDDLHTIVGKKDFNRKRINKPEYRYVFETNQLELYIPEMRIGSNIEDTMLRVSLQGEITTIDFSIEARYYRTVVIGTIEKHFLINKFEPGLTCAIYENNKLFRSYDLHDKYFIFDINGDQISLPCKFEQDAFILIQYEMLFDSSDFSLFYEDIDKGYKIFQVHIDEDSCFTLGNVMVSPFFTEFPVFRIMTEELENGAYLLTNEGESIKVYHRLPRIQIRCNSEDDLFSHFPAIINGKNSKYTIFSSIMLMDGSGDSCYTVGFENTGNDEYQNKIIEIVFGVNFKYRLDCIVLTDLKFCFTKLFYLTENDVRVKSLEFKNSSQLFTRNYLFPMKDRNTKFKLLLNGMEFRLCLVPPSLDICLSDGSVIKENVWHSIIALKTLYVSRSFHDTCLELSFESGLKRRYWGVKMDSCNSFDLSCLHRDNTFSNRVDVSICFKVSGIESIVKIFTVYSVFYFLKPMKFVWFDSDRSIRNLVNGNGEYLLFECIGDPLLTYEFEFKNYNTGEISVIDIPDISDSVIIMKLSEKKINDGYYNMAILSNKVLMGMSNTMRKIEYKQEDIEIISGEIYQEEIIFENLEQISFQEENHKLEISSEVVGVKLHDRLVIKCVQTDFGSIIHNFYLEIVGEMLDGYGYLANGFSILKKLKSLKFATDSEKRKYHHSFNPYKISNILKITATEIIFDITDKSGDVLLIDGYGAVNSLKYSNKVSLSTNRIKGYIC